MPSISSRELLVWKKKQLSKGGNKQSLDLLLELAAGLSRNEINLLRINSESILYLKKTLDLLQVIWDNHLYNYVPIQHLCGYTFWRNLKLQVSEKVLIPRSETELIVDIILGIFKNKTHKLLFAELGTGSGAISIALALAKPLWDGIATDIDKSAISIASRNFINSSNQSNLKFYCGHWWNPLDNYKGELDLVISNPPYIPEDIYKKLPDEVRNFEPKIALLGGEDGLVHIREIVLYAPIFLREKGWLIIENHFDQGAKVKNLFLQNNFTSVEVFKDYSGIGRFTIGRYK